MVKKKIDIDIQSLLEPVPNSKKKKYPKEAII